MLKTPSPTPSLQIQVQLTIGGHGEVAWGQMSSNEVTIFFLPISRDGMEIETRKWCHAAWLVEPLRMLCILTYLGHDLTLVWPWPDLRSDFQIHLSKSKKYMFRAGSTRRTRWCHFYFRISHIHKVINEKPPPWKRLFFIWWPLEPKLR